MLSRQHAPNVLFVAKTFALRGEQQNYSCVGPRKSERRFSYPTSRLNSAWDVPLCGDKCGPLTELFLHVISP